MCLGIRRLACEHLCMQLVCPQYWFVQNRTWLNNEYLSTKSTIILQLLHLPNNRTCWDSTVLSRQSTALCVDISLHQMILFSASKVEPLYFSGRQRVSRVELCFRLSISLVAPPAPIETQAVRPSCLRLLLLDSIPANALAPVSCIGFPFSSNTVSLLLPDMASASSHVMPPSISQYWRYNSVRLFFFTSSAENRNKTASIIYLHINDALWYIIYHHSWNRFVPCIHGPVWDQFLRP